MDDYKELKLAVDKLGKEYILELTKQLIAADKKASGKLLRSLNYNVIEVLGTVMLRIAAERYLLDVDKGRKPGKMPPTSPIKKWIDVRKIKPKDMTRDQLAFVIARSIKKKGIQPTNVIQKTIDNILKNKTKILAEAASKDVMKQIDKILINL